MTERVSKLMVRGALCGMAVMLVACTSPLRKAPFPLASSAQVDESTTKPHGVSAAAANGSVPGGTIIGRTIFPGGFDGAAMAVDSTHHRVVVGLVNAKAAFGEVAIDTGGASHAMVMKLDASNKPVWIRHFGGKNQTAAVSVAIDDRDDIWVGGHFYQPSTDILGVNLKNAGIHDIFLAKLDAAGQLLFAKRFGDTQDQIDVRVRSDRQSGVMVSGWFNGALELGAGPVKSPLNKSFFVAHLASDGHALWSRAFGHRLDFATTDSAIDPQGDVWVSGASDGVSEFVAGGHPSQKDDLGPVLLKIASDGKTQLSKRFGHGADNLETTLAVDGTGALRMVTQSPGVIDFQGEPRVVPLGKRGVDVTKLDHDGNVEWSRRVLTSSGVSLGGVVIDKAGSTILGGRFEEDTVAGVGRRNNGFVMKVDDQGNTVWSLDVSERGISMVDDVVMDGDHILALGNSGSAISETPTQTMWIAELQP